MQRPPGDHDPGHAAAESPPLLPGNFVPAADALPPRLDPEQPACARPPIARSALALLVLLSYILWPMLLGIRRGTAHTAALPSSVSGILVVCAFELGLFAVAFALAVWLGKLTPTQLYLRWQGGGWLVPRALGWSIALRLLVAVPLVLVAGAWLVATGGDGEDLNRFRPKVEALIEFDALQNPLYLLLMVTLVSFVLAGLREELWRAGVIALLGGVFPRGFGGPRGVWWAMLPTAIAFGLGHVAQGWTGVGVTTLLGVGLGAILLWHRSLWDAVFAHGFFNATTFVLIPLLTQYLPHARP